jgi:hypothetical protein
LDLQLPMQSVAITIKVAISNPTHDEVYSMQHYVINFSETYGRPVVFSIYSYFLHE